MTGNTEERRVEVLLQAAANGGKTAHESCAPLRGSAKLGDKQDELVSASDGPTMQQLKPDNVKNRDERRTSSAHGKNGSVVRARSLKCQDSICSDNGSGSTPALSNDMVGYVMDALPPTNNQQQQHTKSGDDATNSVISSVEDNTECDRHDVTNHCALAATAGNVDDQVIKENVAEKLENKFPPKSVSVMAEIPLEKDEIQSVSSREVSHDETSDSIEYDTDTSTSSAKPAVSTSPPSVTPLQVQLHQTRNRLMEPLLRENSLTLSYPGNHTDSGVKEKEELTSRKENCTTSETTSGVSSQDLKIRFATSDSETQTEVDGAVSEPAVKPAVTQDNQTIFHLDKYTHLTKRKRSRGIPNVATWYGMSAVEHLIQNSVNCHSWMWVRDTQEPANTKCTRSGTPPVQSVVVTDATPQSPNPPLLPSSLNPGTSPKSPQKPPLGSPPCDPVMLHQIKEWDSEKSLLEVLSDIGEAIFDNVSPAQSRKSSRRGSAISLADFDFGSPTPSKKKGKVKGDKRLKVPDSVSSVKESIINKCRSSRSISRKSDQQNGKIRSNGSLKKSNKPVKYTQMSLDDSTVQEMAKQIKLELNIDSDGDDDTDIKQILPTTEQHRTSDTIRRNMARDFKDQRSAKLAIQKKAKQLH